jgi:hypothetical protein
VFTGAALPSLKKNNFYLFKGKKMKKIIYLFALFSCMQIVLAQQDSSYLPLAVGNYWRLGSSSLSIEWKVLSDTIFKNRGKYYLLQGEFLEYVRKADNGDIVAYFPQCDSEFVRYPFSFPFSQYPFGYRHKFPRYRSEDCGANPEWSESIAGLNVMVMSSLCCDWGFQKGVGPLSFSDGFNSLRLLEYHLNKPSLKVELPNNLSDQFILYQNYPNPFNPETKINFEIPETGVVKLKVFSITGQEINSLVDETKPAGSYSVIWNGEDKNNLKLSSGVYFYQLTFSSNNNQTTSIKKMIFTK